jgi:hypothetical protein
VVLDEVGLKAAEVRGDLHGLCGDEQVARIRHGE